MRKSLASVVVILTFACLGWAQNSPPADGVGLGNSHLSPNSSDSNVPSMSANVNTTMTDSGGSTSGQKGIPAFAGSPEQSSATSMNSIGTMATRGGTQATFSRRQAYESQSVAKRTQPFLTGFGPAAIGSENQAGQNSQATQAKNQPAQGNAVPPQAKPGSGKR